MAKMFYSTEEAAEKLGTDEQSLMQMVTDGQLQQFRDRDKVMFKREQVDALATERDDESDLHDIDAALDNIAGQNDATIPFAEGTDPIDLGTDEIDATPSEKEATNTDVIDLISTGTETIELSDFEQPMDLAFTPTETDLETPTETPLEARPSEETVDTPPTASAQSSMDSEEDLSEDDIDEDLLLEQIGSGSGLLDLTNEADDTSLDLNELLSAEELPTQTGSLPEHDAPPEQPEDATAAMGQTDTIGDLGSVGDIGTMDSMGDLATATETSAELEDLDTTSDLFDGSVEIDISTSGLENLQDIGEPSTELPPPVPMMEEEPALPPEPFDFSGNGLGIGTLLVSVTCLLLATVIVIYALLGVPSDTTNAIAKNPAVYTGGLLALTIVLGLAGMFMGNILKGKSSA